jgi:predicted PurR-regulated permease PerM
MIKNVLKLLLVQLLIATLGYLIYASRTIILYFIVSAAIALIGRPLVKLLGRITWRGKQMGEGLRAFITMLLMLTTLSTTLGVFLPMIFQEITHLSQMDVKEIRIALEPGMEWLNSINAQYGGNGAPHIDDSFFLEYIYESLDIKAISGIFNKLLGVFGNFLIAVFSVAFMTFFMLKEEDIIGALVIMITPRSKEAQISRILANIRYTLSRYFLGLLLQVTAITTCVFIGLSIFGVKNALLIAFFTGVANLIPYIGPWIGATFGLFIIVSNNIELGWVEIIRPKIIGLLITVVITQLLDNYVFQPTIFSNSINAHPMEVFIVILVAGTVGGVLGMIAAVPVYAIIRISVIALNREFRILERIKEK